MGRSSKIAEQTRSATVEISTTIEEMGRLTGSAAAQAKDLASQTSADPEKVQSFRRAMREVVGSFDSVRALSERMDEALSEQSQGALLVASKVEAVAQGAGVASRNASKTTDSAHELELIAKEVSESVSMHRAKKH